MADYATEKLTTVGNPYLPLWEHIPDGEPYVFDDPDNPGKQRVYIYGSHDDLITEYCGRDQVVWSAPVEDLTQWRYDGVILVVDKNRDGEKFDSAGTADVLYAPDVTLVTDSTGKILPRVTDQTDLSRCVTGTRKIPIWWMVYCSLILLCL